MKLRIIASAAAVLFATVALSGCVSENTETADGAAVDASSKDVSCQIITTDLSEYTAQLAKGTDGFSDYTPSTMLSFQQGAVEKLTTVSQKLEHKGVKDAVLKVRDSASELIPPLEKIVENPETWTDGSMDAEIFEANQRSTDALADLGELCPGVVETR